MYSFIQHISLNTYHVQVCTTPGKPSSDGPCAQERDDVRAGTYDKMQTDHLETSDSLHWQPLTMVKYLPAHQSNLDSLSNQQRSETRNISNLMRYPVLTALLALVPFSSILFLTVIFNLIQHRRPYLLPPSFQTTYTFRS